MSDKECLMPAKDTCPCPKVQCKNHGKCCQCIQAHRANGKLTSCMAMIANSQK